METYESVRELTASEIDAVAGGSWGGRGGWSHHHAGGCGGTPVVAPVVVTPVVVDPVVSTPVAPVGTSGATAAG